MEGSAWQKFSLRLAERLPIADCALRVIALFATGTRDEERTGVRPKRAAGKRKRWKKLARARRRLHFGDTNRLDVFPLAR